MLAPDTLDFATYLEVPILLKSRLRVSCLTSPVPRFFAANKDRNNVFGARIKQVP